MSKKRTLSIKEYELPVEINADTGGKFVATCPIWQDCYAQGESVEEAISEISYVAGLLIELCREEGIEIPLKLKKQSTKRSSLLSFKFPLIVSAN